MYRIDNVKKSRNSTKSNQIHSPSLPGGEKSRRIPNRRNSVRSRAGEVKEREKERGEVIQREGVKREREEDSRKGEN